MLRNYLMVAIRNLWRNKIVSVINIAGLSIGLACCMLIFLFAKDEWSYDRFQPNKDRLYRVTAQLVDDQGKEQFRTGKTGAIHGPSFQRAIPEIAAVTRIAHSDHIIRHHDQTFSQSVHIADPNFFSVFSFPLLRGNPATALSGIQNMVVTDETAIKYFGTTDVIGQTLEVEFDKKFQPFVITGVAKKCPQNSTIKFDVLLSYAYYDKTEPDDQWLNFDLSTFVLLRPGATPAIVLAKMTNTFKQLAAEQLKADREQYGFKGTVNWGLQPLIAIHLSKDYDAEDELSDASNPMYSYILTGIAAFILLVACINFVNLTVARSLKRSKEIGIRKVVGGRRSQLILQFLGESFLACGISFGIALLLAFAAVPVFNELANKQLSLSYLLDTPLVLGFAGFFLLTGFAAGFYPALVLSGFNPVETLYQRLRFTGKNYFARSLMVVQFALAGLLIICTTFLFQQFHFLTHQDLGYNEDNLVVVNVNAANGRQMAHLFGSELLRNPAIQGVAVHNGGRWGTVAKSDGQDIQFDFEHVDENYLPVMQIPLTLGRNFSPQYPADSSQSAIVNETFVRKAGWKNPIGKTIDLHWQNRKMTVIGVVRDFHFRPLNEKIEPELFASGQTSDFLQFNIRISPIAVPQTLAFVESTFKRLEPNFPFSYTFRKDANLHAYDAGQKWKQIMAFAAAFTIFISCIGLFGLTMLAAERRVKEIGIRKVLGASVPGLARILGVGFLQLVLLANLIAIPIAWWAVNKWLDNFAYHIIPRWWVFAAAVLITLLIALTTTAIEAVRAALANPVKSLRTE
ncbi:MAG TPA: ABC transporter permease [Puia sp.]|nr:ABC transporter permease [Puia sp.]